MFGDPAWSIESTAHFVIQVVNIYLLEITGDIKLKYIYIYV